MYAQGAIHSSIISDLVFTALRFSPSLQFRHSTVARPLWSIASQTETLVIHRLEFAWRRTATNPENCAVRLRVIRFVRLSTSVSQSAQSTD